MLLRTEASAEFNRVTGTALDHSSIRTLNRVTCSKPAERFSDIQTRSVSASHTQIRQVSASPIQASATTAYGMTQKIPELTNRIQKGQKVQLGDALSLGRLKICLGWNTTNPECDVDVSAFILGSDGRVLGEEWFVFYGQTKSPDGSVVFSGDEPVDRESITVSLNTLTPSAAKIVFVLTINDAFAKHLNFSMLKDAYIRIIETGSYREIVSFSMRDYYENVISMMIGEIYLYKGSWKFHAIGDGVARDLAGLCEFYGVEVI